MFVILLYMVGYLCLYNGLIEAKSTTTAVAILFIAPLFSINSSFLKTKVIGAFLIILALFFGMRNDFLPSILMLIAVISLGYGYSMSNKDDMPIHNVILVFYFMLLTTLVTPCVMYPMLSVK